jgi:tetratricopeptide (TPR) repeat protein
MGGYTLPSTIGMYRDYLATFQLFCQTRYTDVIATGNRVLEKSPEFIPVMGLVRFAYWNLGRTTEADSVHGRLEQLRDGMTPSERVEHDWMGGLIDGDTSLAARSAEEMFQIDPTSKYGFAAGFTEFRMRRLDAAVERFLAVDLDLPCQSAWFPWWHYMASAYHLLGRYEEELSLAQRGSARFPDHPRLYDMELRVAAANGRLGVIDSLLTRVADLPPPGSLALGMLAINAALELRAHGHAERAERFIERGIAWFAGRPPGENRSERGQAFIAAERWADADTVFAGMIRDAAVTDNSIYLSHLGYRGVALAHLGRHDEALELSRRLENIPGRAVLASYGSAARAAIAAALGQPEPAIRLLNDAFQHGYPYDIFMHQSPWWEPLRNEAGFKALVRPK